MTKRLIPLVAFALAFALGIRAHAVIAVKLPVADMYSGARNVIIGQIVKVNTETGAIEASGKALKGNLSGDTFRFKVEGLPKILENAKPGSPFLLLTGRRAQDFALHTADT